MSEMDSWHEIDLEYKSIFENLNLPKMRKMSPKLTGTLNRDIYTSLTDIRFLRKENFDFEDAYIYNL